jgi:hypothetical protein
MQPKKFGKFFGPKKGDLLTGINCQKKFFLSFFLEFLGDFVYHGTKPEEIGFFFKFSKLVSLR